MGREEFQNMNLKTYFVSHERLSKEDALAQYQKVESYEFVQQILDALPYAVFIVNKYRQIVFSNDVFLEIFGIQSVVEAVGLRPGEIFKCIYRKEMESGCGTSKKCRYCDALGTVIESQKKKEKISRESRVIAELNNKQVHFDFLFTATPFSKDDEEYTIVTVNDVSDETRRRALERVFFHDLLNIVGGMKGLIDFLIKSDNPEKIKIILPIFESIGERLMEEIGFQNDLLSAENDEMKAIPKMTFSTDIVEQAVHQVMYHDVAKGKDITIDLESSYVSFDTDSRLLKRTLVNMIKNALEASSKGEEIGVGCYSNGQNIDFVVSNPGYMDDEVQTQLFQRSFSTKGNGRGIGTYSMKLFVERYLGGKISFKTSIEKGTSFKVSIPLD